MKTKSNPLPPLLSQSLSVSKSSFSSPNPLHIYSEEIHVRTQPEVGCLQTRKSSLQKATMLHPDLRLPASRIVRRHLFAKSPSLSVLLLQPKQMSPLFTIPQNQLSLNVMIPSLTLLLFVPPHPYCSFYEDQFYIKLRHHWASLVAQREPPACNEGDLGSIPGWGRSPGEGNGNPLQYSCLENPMDRQAW